MYFLKQPKQSGFSFVEILIVVIVLAVLASVAIPLLSNTRDVSKSGELDSTLAEIRNAVELYYHQHGEYPSVNTAGEAYGDSGSEESFAHQLTMYTSSNGLVSSTKTKDHKYGPYLKNKQIPLNPMDQSRDLVITSRGESSPVGTNEGGWWFDNASGTFIANIDSQYNR